MRRLFCLLGFHKRSRGLAYDNGETIVSVCRHCGIAMKKQQDGRWVVASPGLPLGGAGH